MPISLGSLCWLVLWRGRGVREGGGVLGCSMVAATVAGTWENDVLEEGGHFTELLFSLVFQKENQKNRLKAFNELAGRMCNGCLMELCGPGEPRWLLASILFL
jgi:hypothetical protein